MSQQEQEQQQHGKEIERAREKEYNDESDMEAQERTKTRAIPSPLWASGFSFSDATLLAEVPYDPRLHYLFFGEEVSMAARLFTSG